MAETPASPGPARAPDPERPPVAGLARERTVLAWNRSGLALVVCIAVLLRHAWPLEGTGELIAIVAIAAAGVVWAIGLFTFSTGAANRLEETVISEKVFRSMTIGTVLLAGAAFVLAFFAPS
jgi:uncharacterized membrane protein YidH (DUF202 family)